jgi:catechol 2,3-dioxygenase-like lactoylglutathione lyase family enzyme
MKFGFKGIHHVGVSVPSMAEAKAFYVDTLGFDLVDAGHFKPSEGMDNLLGLQGADCHQMMVNAGNVILEIFEFHHPDPGKQQNRPVCDHGYTHLAFEVEDIQAACDYLGDAGVTWHHAPVKAGKEYWVAYGRDPFGNVIEIHQLKNGTTYSFDQLSLPH